MHLHIERRNVVFVSLLVVSAILNGCASHAWAPPAGKTAADFDAQKARCSLFARNGGQGFAAAGSTSFVAGAAVGNAIGNGIKAQQDFNDCMSANGWTIADKTPERQAADQEKVNRLKSMGTQRVSCVATVRADPAFTAILGHLPDAATSKFTISQLADLNYPSEEEARVFALYSDRSISCRDTFVAAIASVSPSYSQLMRDSSAGVDADTVLLVRRQLTWGEWSTRLKQSNEDLLTKLRAVRL